MCPCWPPSRSSGCATWPRPPASPMCCVMGTPGPFSPKGWTGSRFPPREKPWPLRPCGRHRPGPGQYSLHLRLHGTAQGRHAPPPLGVQYVPQHSGAPCPGRRPHPVHHQPGLRQLHRRDPAPPCYGQAGGAGRRGGDDAPLEAVRADPTLRRGDRPVHPRPVPDVPEQRGILSGRGQAEAHPLRRRGSFSPATGENPQRHGRRYRQYVRPHRGHRLHDRCAPSTYPTPTSRAVPARFAAACARSCPNT